MCAGDETVIAVYRMMQEQGVETCKASDRTSVPKLAGLTWWQTRSYPLFGLVGPRNDRGGNKCYFSYVCIYSSTSL